MLQNNKPNREQRYNLIIPLYTPGIHLLACFCVNQLKTEILHLEVKEFQTHFKTVYWWEGRGAIKLSLCCC